MDYYLKTTSKEAFIEDLKNANIEIGELDNYYQDDKIIIDWIGQIPNPVEVDEEGNVIGEVTYIEGQHVNIRTIEPIDISLFENTVNVHPNKPFRVFS
jgi:hypothetical protein